MNKAVWRLLLTMPMVTQFLRFAAVGFLAAIVHFSVVVGLVQGGIMQPLAANVIAFLIAFQVSYFGHRRFTFRGTRSRHRQAYPKLILLQLANFAANETLFYLLLKLQLPYPVALLIVLSILPLVTFRLSRLWIFR